MIIVKEWSDFINDIIDKNETFSIYGMGIVAKKLVSAFEEKIAFVFDQNYETIELKSKIICLMDNTEISIAKGTKILICLDPFRNYRKRAISVVEKYASMDADITFYLLDDLFIKKTGFLYWKNEIVLIDNLKFLVDFSF